MVSDAAAQQKTTSAAALLAVAFALFIGGARALPTTALLSSGGVATFTQESTQGPSYHSVQLRKQYVPVMKDGKPTAYKTSYFSQILVGVPEAKPFWVVMDTGSGNLILPSVSCASETCLKHRRYNSSESASSVDVEFDGKPIEDVNADRDQVSIAFGTGEVTGEFVRETLCLGPQRGCVELQVVLGTEMTEDPFGLFDFDGVLGLGLSALTLDDNFGFFGQMLRQSPQLQPQIGVFLARHDEGENVVTFGGYDKTRASSELAWSPVANPDLGYWQVQIVSMRIGDVVVNDCADGQCNAILDTGTSLLGVPRSITRTMQRQLARPVPQNADGTQPIDCRTVPGLKVHFELAGGTIVSLTNEEYSKPTPLNLTLPNRDPSWQLYCRSLLLPVDIEEPLSKKTFIWGEPVLRRYFTVYDVAEKRIGFSEAAEAPEGIRGLPPINPPPIGSLLSGAPMQPPARRGREGGDGGEAKIASVDALGPIVAV